MEDVLDVYAKPYDKKAPVICLDEKSKQLLADSRPSLPTAKGKIAIQDYEYVRKGTGNIFVAVEPLARKRITQVTRRRTKLGYALFLERLVKNYPKARSIHLVQDNLNTHFLPSLIEAFGVRKAQSLWKKIVPHYTPKHASWLNMAEIEINALSTQCLDRRLASLEKLHGEVEACTARRNRDRTMIRWTFSREKAKKKFPTLYSNELNG